MRKSRIDAILLPALLAFGLLLVGLLQSTAYQDDLAGYALFRGRIVLSSGDLVYPDDDPESNGAAARVLDSDPDRPAILRFPAAHPHGTFLLIDTALTHSPAGSDAEHSHAPPRSALALEIYNGACRICAPERFRAYGRIKRARVQLLYRRANNPDEEFVIPQARPVFERIITLPDEPGPFSVSLRALPPEAPSPGWPDGMQYMITRLEILEVYPGEVFADRFALGEIVYVDRPAPDSPPFRHQRL